MAHDQDRTRAAARSAMVALRIKANAAKDKQTAANYQRQINCHDIATALYRRGGRWP